MPKIGLTFATVLRAALRQDPDVLLVGEIRDRETAEIALRASMTGHLVLSKLHTNDAISSATRLLDIGIEGYLAAASLRGILAQRLVRKICEKCREEAAPDDQQYAWLNALVGKDRASAVAAQLREIGAIPLTIAPAKAESCPALALTWFKTTVKIDELIIFSHQMATLAKAGISIVRAVRTLRVGAQSAPCGGAGRSGGRPRRRQYLELERETVKRLKSATRYPSFVLIAIGVAIAILNVFVIPAFASVFAKFHAQLPPTRSSTGSRRPMVGMHGTG